jgi:hypothetical protein
MYIVPAEPLHQNIYYLCRNLGFHIGGYEEFCLLGHNAM